MGGTRRGHLEDASSARTGGIDEAPGPSSAASEPKLFVNRTSEIGKPITMAWDHKGRLWVSETVDYPNSLQTRGEGHDQIKICEDTDGDGKADKFTVFADKLSIPTSMVFANGGVILTSVPDTLFLQDTDGDDKADVRRVLFTGWGTQDTHAGPSNLHYGYDNWIYGCVGYSGFRGTVGGERMRFGQGFYTGSSPDGSEARSSSGSTNNNSWGVSFTEDGLLVGSTANGCPRKRLSADSEPLITSPLGARLVADRPDEYGQLKPVLSDHGECPAG